MQKKRLLTDDYVEAAEKVLAKGERTLTVPIKDGVRLFSLNQKEIKFVKQEEVSQTKLDKAPMPTPNTMDYLSFAGCGCSRKTNYKENCYFYEAVRDMGATIPTCNYYAKLGYCPCEDCNKYISKSTVFEMVKNKVAN
ncbi:MAG: hypothetical protein K2J73_08560 [Oscillospiraceae bacterium]|nr:hypothetical protein [Oscillospiraceae bacterium]